jgi:glutamate-1-semialdehyde 2,1-aminomutase
LNWTATEDYSVDEIRTYFMQEVFKRGLLVLSTHNVTLAHTPSIIDGISDIYTEVFGRLNRAISDRTLQEELKVSPLKPLFKVR